MHLCVHMCIHTYRETCKMFCHHPFYEGTLGNNQLPISSVLLNIKKKSFFTKIFHQRYRRVWVSYLQDLMLNGLRWSLGKNKNKVYNKCNTLQSSWNYIPTPGHSSWKIFLLGNWSLVPKTLGTVALEKQLPQDLICGLSL